MRAAVDDMRGRLNSPSITVIGVARFLDPPASLGVSIDVFSHNGWRRIDGLPGEPTRGPWPLAGGNTCSRLDRYLVSLMPLSGLTEPTRSPVGSKK